MPVESTLKRAKELFDTLTSRQTAGLYALRESPMNRAEQLLEISVVVIVLVRFSVRPVPFQHAYDL